ncbi:phospholipid-transporting ATPase ABCA3-like [Amblyomma americanum]
MTYLIAERSLSTGGAISSVLLWIYLGGLVSLPLSLLGTLAFGPKQAHYIFLAFPPYALLSCFQKIWVADAQAMECELLQKEGSEREPPVSASAVSFGTGAFFPQASPNEDAKEVLESLLDVCNAKPLYALEYNAMGFEILALLATGLACLGTMAFLTSGFLLPGDAFAGKEVSADEDVEEEKKVIATLRDKKNFSDHTMLAWNLHKRFGDVRAVRGVYVALKPSECFGLLGVNGAGKTTTFQMLAGLESVSYGDAMTQTALLSKNVREWQSQISYCFQTGGLIDSMNAYEYLYLIGRLRGISNADLKPMVASIVNVVDLQEHAWKECGVYRIDSPQSRLTVCDEARLHCSGGNRRKLCIGATLLGLQPFVFLDEPYAGVDVVSRNKIFRAIAEIKKRSKTSFMLTSHNMDECEYSCDRLTIMVGGQMMCLGTLQHLREKFGRGFRMEFMLKHTATADAGRLASAVEQQFSGIRLTDWHENVLCYHLEQRIPWSTLFTKLAQLEKEFALEHALVGENTLEQIFLSFAKMQGHSVQPDTIGQNAVAAPPVVILQPSSTPSTASARVSKSGSTKSGLSS